MTHLYAALLQEIADGGTLQYAHPDGAWRNCVIHNVFAGAILRGEPLDSHYRIAPKTRRIGEFDVPYGLKAAPPEGTTVWIADVASGAKELVFETNYTWPPRLLALGLLHSTREAAELHVKALRSL